jgi:DNA-binding IclR family transcriptional regulator
LIRALKIFEFLSSHPESCNMTVIAEKLGFPKNSVFRILKTLTQYGYLKESGKSYQLSTKFLALGHAALGEANLTEKSIDIMRELRDTVKETTLLGTINGSQGVVLEEVLGTHHVNFMINIGHVFHLYTSGPGKAMLAYLSDEERDRILDQITFQRFTKRTITSRKAFLKELAGVRDKGYAIDRAEKVEGLHCVSAPIFNHRKYPIAAIWITGPIDRFPASDFDRLGKIVLEHALRISQRFGYDPDIGNH